ncbi:hypothetical protein [uncultured Clostridium sp.]|uniref:hypothetical protein n=1 Tax=uncultured Clostridium sp. TaxID=59620 RepID=UPI0025F2BA74|nr:hypothetical protein [uncultured Clostridium sp.]
MIRINNEFIAISKANFVLSLEFHNWNQEKLNGLQERCRTLRNQIVHSDPQRQQRHLVRSLNKTLKQIPRQGEIVARQRPNHIDNRNGRHYQIEYFDYRRI